MDYKLFSDEILVKLLKASDNLALKEVYDRYWRQLYFTCLRKLKSKLLAEEIVQNIFLSIWEKRFTVHIDNLEKYLNTAARYQIINCIKTQLIHERHHSAIKAQITMESNEPETRLLLRELSLAIDKAIGQLPPKTQQVFVLSRFEQRSIKEIASCLGISEKAVEYHITQSIRFLRVSLKDYMVYVVFVFPWLL